MNHKINFAIIIFGATVSSFLCPAQAAELKLSGSEISFPEDTSLEFEFQEAHGAYQSTFGVFNLETQEKIPLLFEVKPSDVPQDVFRPSSYTNHLGTEKDFLSTPGNAVSEPLTNFLFKANTRYTLYMESSYDNRPAGTIYSTDGLNPGGEQLVRQTLLAADPSDPCAGEATLLGWDDTGTSLAKIGQEDRDFDDFLVRVREEVCAVGGGALPVVGGGAPGGGGGGPGIAPLGALAGLIPLLFLGGDSDAGPPPVVTPPGGQPPVVTPPGGQPPVVTPPGGQPPVVTPPGGQPPVVTPPVVTPPGGQPPVVTPPGGQPPVVTPPGGQPPVVTPPKEVTPEPVPEPSSALGLGLVGALSFWFKRKQARRSS